MPSVQPRRMTAQHVPVLVVCAVMTLAACVALVLSTQLAAAVGGAGATSDRPWPLPAPGTYRPPLTAPVVDPFRPPAVRWGSGNRGLEYGVVGGEPVGSVADGRVVFAGAVAGRLAITVVHPDGRRSSLTNLAVVLVASGQLVAAGEVMGLAAPGLHLGVREGDRYIDPASLFAAARRHARLVPTRR